MNSHICALIEFLVLRALFSKKLRRILYNLFSSSAIVDKTYETMSRNQTELDEEKVKSVIA